MEQAYYEQIRGGAELCSRTALKVERIGEKERYVYWYFVESTVQELTMKMRRLVKADPERVRVEHGRAAAKQDP